MQQEVLMMDRGEGLLDNLLDKVGGFQRDVMEMGNYKILGRESIGLASIYDVDKTKIVLASSCIGGRALEEKLRRDYNIQAEMSDGRNILLISTVGDDENAFASLTDALYNINKDPALESSNKVIFKPIKYKTCLNIRTAYYSKKKTIKLKEAIGCISGEMVVPYPPGIPVLLPGELITKEIVEYIELVKLNGIQLNGINDLRGENILIIDV